MAAFECRYCLEAFTLILEMCLVFFWICAALICVIVCFTMQVPHCKNKNGKAGCRQDATVVYVFHIWCMFCLSKCAKCKLAADLSYVFV